MNLMDDYTERGDNLSRFKDEIKKIVHATFPIEINFARNDFTIFSYIGWDEEVSGYWFYELNKETLERLREKGMLKRIRMPATYVNNSLMEDMIQRKINLMIGCRGRIYYLSKYAVKALCEKSGLKGEWIKEQSLSRDLYLMETLSRQHKNYKMIVRMNQIYEGNVSKYSYKAFGFVTCRHHDIPFYYMTEIMERIENERTYGKVELREWQVTHRLTHIYMEFPDEASRLEKTYQLLEPVIPGIVLYSSDTGAASFTALVTYRIPSTDTYLITNEWKRNHQSFIEIDEIMQNITRLLGEIDSLPMEFEKMQNRVIYEKRETDSVSDFRKKNAATVEHSIRKWIKDIELGSFLKTGRKERFEREQICEIDPGKVYTQYDLAKCIFQSQKMIASMKDQVQAKKTLAKCFGKLPAKANEVTLSHIARGIL